MVSFSTARHHKGSRLKRGVNKRLTGLLSGHLSLGSASQCSRRHLEYRAAAVRPFAVRKASRCLPNGVDQASFAGFVEGDANRPIEVDMFHHCAEHLPRIEVPNITASGGLSLALHVPGGHAIHVADENASFLRRRAEREAGIFRFAGTLKRGQACLSRIASLVAVFGLCRPFVHKPFGGFPRAADVADIARAKSMHAHPLVERPVLKRSHRNRLKSAARFDATAAGWHRASKRIATRAILTTGAASAVAQQHAGLTGGFDELCPDIMAGTRTRQRIT
jgi:hypothetical protein